MRVGRKTLIAGICDGNIGMREVILIKDIQEEMVR